MTAQTKRNGLADIAGRLRRKCSNTDKMCFGDLFAALESRGFGPLLLIPVFMIVLPTGAIPGVPDIAALFIVLVAIQMLMGRTSPWMPERLEKINVRPKKVSAAVKKAAPVLRKIDSFTHRRAVFLTTPLFQKIIALLLIVQSAFIVAIGMIPFVPDVLVLPVLLLALGLSVRDGMLVLAGLGLLFASGGIAVYFLVT